MRCHKCYLYVSQEKYCAYLAKQIDPEKPQCKVAPLPTICLWSFRTDDSIEALAWSSNGLLAIGDRYGKVHIFSEWGVLLWSFRTNGSVEALAWSSSGLLAVGDRYGKVHIFGSLAMVRAVLRRKLYNVKVLLNLV